MDQKLKKSSGLVCVFYVYVLHPWAVIVCAKVSPVNRTWPVREVGVGPRVTWA